MTVSQTRSAREPNHSSKFSLPHDAANRRSLDRALNQRGPHTERPDLSRFDHDRYETYHVPLDGEGQPLEVPARILVLADEEDGIDSDRSEYGFNSHDELVAAEGIAIGEPGRREFEQYTKDFRQREHNSVGVGFNNKGIGADGYSSMGSPREHEEAVADASDGKFKERLVRRF